MKPKRILIVSAYFPPQPSIASLRAYSFAKYWAGMGHNVTVLTTKKFDRGGLNLSLPVDNFTVIEVAYFDLAHTVDKILKSVLRMKQEAQNNSDVHSLGSKVPVQRNRAFVIINNILRSISHKTGLFVNDRIPDVRDTWIRRAVNIGNKQFEKRKFEWILSSYGPPASHIVGGILSKKNNCKWVADYRDLWIENHVWVGKWPFTSLEKYLEKRYVGTLADIITTVSEPLAEVLRKKFPTPVHVIENGFDEDDYNISFHPYFTEEKKRIVYTGAIYPGKQDPSPLFAAITALAHESDMIRGKLDDQFEVLFFGSRKEWLINLIREHHVEQWVKYCGLVSRDDALRIQKQADILLFLEWENGAVDGILTGKLFEYLATRKPILGIGVSSKTAPGALMEQAGVGLAVGNDIEKIRHVILNLLEGRIPFRVSPDEDIIARYTRQKQAERLLEIMDQHGHI